jgi:hypothetical protein
MYNQSGTRPTRKKESLMNTTITLPKGTDREVLTLLWQMKNTTERDMADLIDQGHYRDADAAWDRIIEICRQIRRFENYNTFATR